MSGLSTCNVSACNGSVNNVPDRSCNYNVNALSVVVPNDCADLSELSLPKIKNSSKQVVVHLLWERDEYYIRYAGMASMLNPAMSEEDLVGALINHFPPEIKKGMICGNLKKTQDALAFWGNADIRIYATATQETALRL